MKKTLPSYSELNERIRALRKAVLSLIELVPSDRRHAALEKMLDAMSGDPPIGEALSKALKEDGE